VLRKHLVLERRGQKVGEEVRYFFYITNQWIWERAEVVSFANDRGNQENLIEQLKNGVRALRAPVNTLEANGAYMVIASLAWSVKAWLALLQPCTGNRKALLTMEFKKFLQEVVLLPCQVVRAGRRLVYRLLQSVVSATQQWSCCQIEQAPREISKSFLLCSPPHHRSDFSPEDLALQRFALVRVRRPPLLGVPRRSAAVYQRLLGALPRPRLHEAVPQQVDRKRPDARVHVAHLLLARPPHLLDVLERLLDGAAIGHRLQHLRRRRLRVRAEVGQPAVRLAHDDHADAAPRRAPRGHERLDRLDHLPAVLHARHPLPAALLPGPLGQVDPRLPVGRQRPALAGAARRRRHVAQVGVPAQPADNHQAQCQDRLEERPLGVGAVDREPQGLAGPAHPPDEVAHQFGGEFQLGAEGPGVLLGQRRHVL